MLRPEQRNPAAPEMLGSEGAGGAEGFDRSADDDQEDTSPAGFDQSFLAQCETVQGYARPQCRSDRSHTLSSAGRLP
jgi:hypothetical protein